MTSTPTMDGLFAQLHEKLITTGEWERLVVTLIRKLNESGWTDDLRDVGKEKARTMRNLRLLALTDEMQDYAKSTVPKPVKDEMLKLIRTVIEDYVEK